MPQMMPLSWMTLFMFFNLLFIMFNIMNYYQIYYMIKPQSFNKFLLKYNWKW